MISSIRWAGLLAAFLCVACGDSGGSGGTGGDGGGGGSSVSNDPGREVDGCFDCADTEYCLIVSGDTDDIHCAKSECADDCECMIADGKTRLEVCQNYSCQDGGGILYCFEE